MSAIQQLNPIIDNLYRTLFGDVNATPYTAATAEIGLGVYGNKVTALWDLLEALYNKTTSIIPSKGREAFSSVVIGPRVGYYHSKYGSVKNTYSLLLNNFSISKPRDWDTYQYMVDKIFLTLEPITFLALLSTEEKVLMLERAGIVEFSTTITATDGTGIAAGLTPGLTFINAWNNLLVPYQASINAPTYYITGIAGPSPADHYYRKTGQIKAKVYATFPV